MTDGRGPRNRFDLQLDDEQEATAVTALLDVIQGAWERAQQGLADVADGRVIVLDDL